MTEIVPCVSGLFHRHGSILLVRRTHYPRRGEWSLPGGKVEEKETQDTALWREMQEETNLHVHIAAQYATTLISGSSSQLYELACYRIWNWSGIARAGDDASALVWIPIRSLKRFLPLETLHVVQRGIGLKQK